MVLLVVAIMATVATPRFGKALSQVRVDRAAQQVKVDLEFARQRARTTSASQVVQFDIATNSYTLPGVAHLDHPGTDYAIHLGKSPYEVTLVSADFDGDAQLVFDGYGVPDSGGTLVMKRGDYQTSITLDPATGKASIE